VKYGRIGAVVLLIAVVLTAEWLWLTSDRDASDGEVTPAIAADAAIPGGAFSLVDHNGRPVTDGSFGGEHLILVFGYTYCPDVCPTTLSSVAAALDLLGAKAERIRPVFVTVDPERDTPAVLADYVAAFHPRLLGLTGSPEQIREAAHNYRVYYAKAGDSDDYLVDHSAYVYLVGPDGRTLTYFKHDATPETIAEAVGRHLGSAPGA